MSIASEITRLQTSKADIKAQVNIDVDDINEGTDFIDEETLDDYADLIEDMQEAYKQYIPINSTSDTQIEAPKGGAIIGKTLKGNTTQDETPTPSSPVLVNNVTGEQVVTICRKNLIKLNLITTPTTYSGVTFTPNNDGTITLNGIATGTRWVDLSNIDYGSTNLNLGTVTNTIKSLTSNNYTMSAKLTNGKVNVNYNANNKFTSCYIYKDTNYNNAILQIQLENGTSATSYEPYQGKDYEINLGKNLLNNSISSQTLNEVTLTANSDGSVTCNGTASATIILNLLSSNLTLQAGTYTLSGCPSGGSVSSKYKLDIYKSSASSFLTYDSGSGATFTLTEETTFDRVRLVIFSGYTATDLTFYPMLEKGSVATSYSPYFTPIELNKIGNYQDFIRKGTGKNLFDISLAPSTGIISNGGFKLTKSSNRTITFLLPQYYEAGTYTISFNVTNSTLSDLNKFGVWFQDSNGNIQVKEGVISNGKFVVSPEAKFNRLYFFIYNSESDSATITTENVQLEKGSNATYYEPYGYKDKWYIEKNVGKVVLNGTQNIALASSGVRRFNATYSMLGITNIKDGSSNTDTTNYRKCDHFVYNTSTTTFGNYYMYSNWLVLYDTNSEIADANALKTWFSNNNTKIYYVLANTTYTLIENEELTEQLDRIMQLYEGQNNILVTGDLAATLDLNYIVKAENHL